MTCELFFEVLSPFSPVLPAFVQEQGVLTSMLNMF